jgi:hypothetical protein
MTTTLSDILPGTVRQPRGIVKINGVAIPGWIDFDIHNNNFASADTFRVKFAGSDLPATNDLNWFSQQEDMYVELFIGFPQDPTNYDSSQLTSWIYGQVDDPVIDPIEYTVELTGRDLTRVFIDTKVTLPNQNLTSSEIVAQFAAGVTNSSGGASPLQTSIAQTTTPVGKYYEIDRVNMNDERSQWDIMQWLARIEGYQAWVRGKTLYFQPAPQPNASTAYPLTYQTAAANSGVIAANFEDIKLRRALTVSRGVQVVIRSWNSKQAKGFTATYPTGKPKSVAAGQATTYGGAQVYYRTIPNLTQADAIKLAQQWYQQIVAHEMNIDVTMPGDNSVDITSVLRLSGTGTAFDQFYFPDSITRTLTCDGGYSMSISAKNHATSSDAGDI